MRRDRREIEQKSGRIVCLEKDYSLGSHYFVLVLIWDLLQLLFPHKRNPNAIAAYMAQIKNRSMNKRSKVMHKPSGAALMSNGQKLMKHLIVLVGLIIVR
jgi:hypothetical protein